MPESPRARLLANQRLASAHFGIVRSPDFQAVADLTLLQVVRDVNSELILPDAPARHFYLMGAEYALSLIQTIANPEPIAKQVQRTDRLT